MTNEEAIKRLKEVQAEFNENWVDYGGINEAFEKAYQALKEKPTGEWEIVDAEGRKIWNCVCTNCGHDPQEYIGGTENWWLTKQHLPNFCPNCGVRIVNVKGGAE